MSKAFVTIVISGLSNKDCAEYILKHFSLAVRDVGWPYFIYPHEKLYISTCYPRKKSYIPIHTRKHNLLAGDTTCLLYFYEMTYLNFTNILII